MKNALLLLVITCGVLNGAKNDISISLRDIFYCPYELSQRRPRLTQAADRFALMQKYAQSSIERTIIEYKEYNGMLNLFEIIKEDDSKTRLLIPSYSFQSGSSNMQLAKEINTPAANRIRAVQERLLCNWDKKDIESILDQAKKNGADLNFTYDTKTQSRTTPLHVLAEETILLGLYDADYTESWQRMRIAQWFINNGANINAVNDQKETPLSISMKFYNQPMIELLLCSKNIDSNYSDIAGCTPLYYAVFMAVFKGYVGNVGPSLYATIQMMLNLCKADPTIKNNAKQTPLDFIESVYSDDVPEYEKGIISILKRAMEQKNK